jgi:hypothetical protein
MNQKSESDLDKAIQLSWVGPYPLYHSSGKSVFDQKEIGESGIYLFTVAYEDGYLVDYVGETGQSFRQRLTDHVRGYLGGEYRIYEASSYTESDSKPIWGGTWLRDRRDSMGEFIARYDELAPRISEYIKLFQIFLCPTKLEHRLRQRVESAVALGLYEQPGLIGSFQAPETRKSYRPKRDDEISIKVKMQVPAKILGLTPELDV